MTRLHQQLLKAIESSGRTRYQIALDSGVSEAQLSRFANHGQRLTVESCELLADALGFQIALVPKAKTRKGR
ncbi:MAG: helix-turn-helix domain-containing protein [Phycisphaeraceae bacterium]|nr:helix-turn-helix domain-containing protein [Phycisphaerales bacterium]MCB9860001.1 helix-turn-helix domain-containing protein [Phycisphaeraceae bacterium]